MKNRPLLTSCTLLLCSMALRAQSPTTVTAGDFPNDGSTAEFTTADGFVSFTTSSFFSAGGDFVGDGGNTRANSWDLDDTLQIELQSGVALNEISWRWTRSDITISGFLGDPQATIGGSGNGSATWDAANELLILDVPWDGGAGRTITFGNPSASLGQTLDFVFSDASPNWQASITSVVYEADLTPAPQPLIHYSFDNDAVTGTTVEDISGNNNDASIVASATAPVTGVLGLFGEAFSFATDDDPDGIVRIPASTVPSGASARTFSLWFNQNTDTGQDKLFGYGTNAGGRAIDLGIEGGGLRIRHWAGSITYGVGYDFANVDTGWHHVALRVNSGATTFADVDVFLDGVRLAPVAGGDTQVALDTADSAFAIGSSATPNSALGFDGLIDEFKAWDSDITTAQVATLAERPPLPTVVSFTATPQNRVPSGSAVMLSWAAENVTSLTLNPGNIDVTGTTSITVNPVTKTTYTLTGSDGNNPDDQDSVTISVGDEPFPNIVVFFLDDFGWSDWEQNGAPTGSVFYETPHMNRLTAEGLYFPNGYSSSPVCSPTRAALLTGQSPAFNKLSQWIPGGGDAGRSIREAEWVSRLPLTTANWARVLSDSGYRTMNIGKWHLGSGTQPEANPILHGFDLNIAGNQFGTPPGPERYFASAAGFSGLPNLGPTVAPQGSYLTDVLTERAVSEIRDAAASDTAFAIYLSHFAVHTPIQAPAATVQKYQDKLDNNPGMDWQGQTNPTYAAMIEHVDLSLGAILAALEDPDNNPATDDSIADNTLVVFTADNGGLIGVTSNRPLRDGKGGNYEGGVREPWVFWWPGKITPGVNPEPIVSHDLFPTLLTQAGISTPDGHVVNGQDLSPMFDGQEFDREEPFIFHYPHWSPQGGSPHSAIRSGDWKLVYNYAGAAWELYNLENDIGETNNLISSEADNHAILSWALANGLEDLGANYPRNTGTLAEEPATPLVTPNEDEDEDGRSDLQELLEGTSVSNPQSTFAPYPTIAENLISYSFLGLADRRYVLLASPNLQDGSWVEIDEFFPTSAGQSVILEDTDEIGSFDKRFYRIQTEFAR